MIRNVFIKFLIPLVSLCLHNETGLCANPTEAELFYHLQQPRHWDLPWFDGINAEHTIHNNGAANLRMVTSFLGCAYGEKLHWFILLTLITISECDDMRRGNNVYTEDCKNKLLETTQRGKLVKFKLMRTLQFIDSVGNINTANNRFYQTLSPLLPYVTGQVPIEFLGAVPGGVPMFRLLKDVNESIGTYLIDTCLPPYLEFNLVTIRAEYRREIHPNGMYDLYINKLNSYIDFIDGHLIQLGFQYDEQSGSITFNPNQNA